MAKFVHPQGPEYPKLPAVEKHRRLAATIEGLTLEAKKAYGRAVLASINSLNRSAFNRELAPVRCPCASGTWHSEGREILKAVNLQNFARLDRGTARPLDEQRSLYLATMERLGRTPSEGALA